MITLGVAKQVIDAVVEAVNAVELPAHATVKYQRPQVVLPEDCPLLSVFLSQKTTVLTGTTRFRSPLIISVVWEVPTVERAVTLIDDEALSLSLLEEVEAIEQALFDLSVQGFPFEGASMLWPVTVDYLPPPDVASGLVDGYVVSVQVVLEGEGRR